MAEASVILRYSNRSERRARNLRQLLALLSSAPHLEMIVSVMEKDIDLSQFKVKKIWNPAPFESSKANNIGAANATTNVYIFQDADILFNLAYYWEILEAIKNGYESVRVGESCVNCGEVTIKNLHGAAALSKFLEKLPIDSIREAPGACLALTRNAFIKIGGHCELFKCYGWEDVYMRYKARKLTKGTCLNHLTAHFPHEINYQIGQQAVNGPIYYQLIEADGRDCKKFAERDRKDLLEKYPVFR